VNLKERLNQLLSLWVDPVKAETNAVALPAPVSADAQGNWLRQIVEPHRSAYKQTLLLALAINLMGLFAAIFSLQVYDRVVAHAGYSTLVALVSGMVLVVVMDHVFRSGRSLVLQQVGARIEVEVARNVMRRMLALPAEQLEKLPPSYWQAVYRDVEAVRGTFSGATALLIIDLPFVLLTLFVVALIAMPLLPVALITITAFVLLAWRSGVVTRDANETEREELVHRDATIAELASARLHLKALAADGPTSARWDGRYASWLNESMARSREADHFREMAHGMTTANTVMVTTVGALLILSQQLTLGALIATSILTGRMVSPLVQLVSQWRMFGQFSSAKKRLDQLFKLPLDRESDAIELPLAQGVLRLDRVSFQYAGTEIQQVQGISGQIGPRGLHGVVGPNGSGKTTLLKLLRGLYVPSEGRVLLEDADLVQHSQRYLARQIGYLAQDAHLLSISVRDNIALGKPDATDEEIVRAAQLAGAHEFLIDSPDGYGTMIGPEGRRFSVGQSKRIMIAQALVSQSPILLMDEPTSELDRETEIKLVLTLRELANHKTIIVVSHSHQLLAHCHGLLVMKDGKLVAAGAAAGLLDKLGIQQARRGLT
jgi:ATP-binding cassette subfamily C protein LapB